MSIETLEYLQVNWPKAGVEILILAVLIYQSWKYFRATRGIRVLAGLVILLITLSLLSEALDLRVIRWIMSKGFFVIPVALVVIFQPEIRRVLADLGSRSLFSFSRPEDEVIEMAGQIAKSVRELSSRRFGALIAIEGDLRLRPLLETGVELDAAFSAELALTIFHPKTALHDGGIIVRGDRILAAGCVFPVTQREMVDRSIGLRHRAGIGITEESDAISIVVSEETGGISICHEGEIERGLDATEFEQRLKELWLLETHETEHPDQEMDSQQLEGKAGVPSAGDSDMVSH